MSRVSLVFPSDLNRNNKKKSLIWISTQEKLLQRLEGNLLENFTFRCLSQYFLLSLGFLMGKGIGHLLHSTT